MALRAIARLRNTCGLQLRTLTYTSQDMRKAFDEGSRLAQKLEKPVLSFENNISHVTEDAVQPERSEDTQFEAFMKIGAPYVRFVVGRRGITRDSIEKATNTHIVIPPAREVKSSVSLVVKGASQESVDAALAEIRSSLQRAEKNSNFQYTHFISLPLASHQALLEQLRSFKESILAEEQKVINYVSWFPETAEKESSNVATINTTNKVTKIKSSHILDPDLEGFFSDDESSDDENERPGNKSLNINKFLIIRPETVHITVLMLKLFTDDRVNVAAEVLQGVKSKVLEILDGQEPKVFLKGIECLRGSPAEARVLCMKVEEADNGKCLQRACQAIKDAYTKAGLVAEVDKKQELKLHATLMNTSFGRRLSNKPFDARKVLAKYRSQEWGEHCVNEVHLSQRFFYDESGYYRCCGSFQLPPIASQSSVQSG